MEIVGTINQLLEIQSGTSKAGNEWKKQEFVIDVVGTQYPRQVCFTMFGEDKINILQGLTTGDEIKVSFDLDSREFNGRWYTNVNAWKVEKQGGTNTPPDFTPTNAPSATDDNDDLPF